MKSLLAVLNDRSKKLKLEMLLQCEQVLHKLYEKIEGRQLYYCSNKSAAKDKYESQSIPSTPDSPGPSPRSPSPEPKSKPESSHFSATFPRVYDDQYHHNQNQHHGHGRDKYEDSPGSRWPHNSDRILSRSNVNERGEQVSMLVKLSFLKTDTGQNS
jgi:hypothetical protein